MPAQLAPAAVSELGLEVAPDGPNALSEGAELARRHELRAAKEHGRRSRVEVVASEEAGARTSDVAVVEMSNRPAKL